MEEFNQGGQPSLKIKSSKKKGKKKKFFLIILIIALLIWGGVKLSGVLSDSQDLEEINQNIIEENSALRSFVFGACQLNGFSDDYYFVEGQTCASFFSDLFAEQSNEINVENSFIDFINVFYATSEEDEDLQAEIWLLQDYSEGRATDIDEERDLYAEFVELAQKQEVIDYLNDFNLKLEERDDYFNFFQEDQVIAQIYKNNKTGFLQFEFLDTEKVIRLDDFSQTKSRAEFALEEFGDFDYQAIKENFDEQSIDQERFEHYLVLGKHQKNVDTIMIATIDRQKETTTLVSLPRDLWVDGRKINSYYYFYGIRGLISRVEKLVGIQVENYILIDMYAFPEVVDKLGGVDYTFKYPLIDPTYKTVDDGEEGTLYFPAGDAHLNGTQALRVARSRHTTSDFARAQRQQEILSAVKDKINQSSKADLGKLVPVMLEKVDTDFNLADLLALVLKVKDYDMRSSNVISTGNVLTSEYYEYSEENRAYILIPREEDWGLIKAYFWNAVYR